MRMIDGDAVKRRIWGIVETWKFQGRKYDALLLESVIAQIVDPQPTLTPPNEPMTLEQLREMDGEPAWIVDVGPHKWYGPGWAIVDRDNCLVRTVKNWNAVFFERYGEQWLAYRRPKEEQ